MIPNNVALTDLRSVIKELIKEALQEAGFQPEKPKEVLTKEQAARHLKISLSTFQLHMRSEGFPMHSIGKRPFFFKHELNEWLARKGR